MLPQCGGGDDGIFVELAGVDDGGGQVADGDGADSENEVLRVQEQTLESVL
jgi:predicted NUDIX family phosphoesterase